MPVKRGSEHHRWKGDKVTDAALHDYVQKRFVKPDACQHCGKPDTGKRHHHWCRRDHDSMSRDPSNWLFLCAGCHIRWDRKDGKQRVSDENLIPYGTRYRPWLRDTTEGGSQ